MLLLFWPIFVANTNIIFGYNFADPLNFSQKLQGNTCVVVSFFRKVAGLRPATLSKKTLQRRSFPINFANFLKILTGEAHTKIKLKSLRKI